MQISPLFELTNVWHVAIRSTFFIYSDSLHKIALKLSSLLAEKLQFVGIYRPLPLDPAWELRLPAQTLFHQPSPRFQDVHNMYDRLFSFWAPGLNTIKC